MGYGDEDYAVLPSDKLRSRLASASLEGKISGQRRKSFIADMDSWSSWPYPRQHLAEVAALDLTNDVGINDSHAADFYSRHFQGGEMSDPGFEMNGHHYSHDADFDDSSVDIEDGIDDDDLMMWNTISSFPATEDASEVNPANISTFVSGTVVRAEEIGIVLVVVALWVGAVMLFFNRWGKIRMLEPYVPPSYLLATAAKDDAPISVHRASCANTLTGMSQLPRVSRPSISIDVHHIPYRNSIVDRYNPILHMPLSRCRSRTNSVFVYSPASNTPCMDSGRSSPRKSRSAENLAAESGAPGGYRQNVRRYSGSRRGSCASILRNNGWGMQMSPPQHRRLLHFGSQQHPRRLFESRLHFGEDCGVHPLCSVSAVSECGLGPRRFSGVSFGVPGERRRSRAGSVDWAAVLGAARANNRLRASSFSNVPGNNLLLGNSASTGAMLTLLGSPLVMRRSSDSARSSIIIQQTIPEIKTDEADDGESDDRPTFMLGSSSRVNTVCGAARSSASVTAEPTSTGASSNPCGDDNGVDNRRNSLAVDFASFSTADSSEKPQFSEYQKQSSLDSTWGVDMGERRFSATSLGKAMALRIPSADESSTDESAAQNASNQRDTVITITTTSV